MAILKDTQYLYSVDGQTVGYFDGSMLKVNTIADVKLIPSTSRFLEQTIIVENVIDNVSYPIELWLVGGIGNQNWKVKKCSEFANFADLESLTNTIISTLKAKGKPSQAFSIGTEVIVKCDETNDNKLSKYWVVEISETNGAPTWERKEYGGSSSGATYWEGDDEEI